MEKEEQISFIEKQIKSARENGNAGYIHMGSLTKNTLQHFRRSGFLKSSSTIYGEPIHIFRTRVNA